MPQLLLVDDDGRELFRGAVSRENVEILAKFLRRHLDTLRGIALIKRAFDRLTPALAAPAPPPRRRRRVRG